MRLLLAEDEPAIAEHLRQSLTAVGYVVDHAADGEDAQFLGDTEPYDAVVLDLGLPKRDGLSVLRAWRASGHRMPVLILTARDSWREKVDGIDAGADDYLAKPFATEELLARLRALLRRAGGHADPVLRHGALELDTRTGRVALDGRLGHADGDGVPHPRLPDAPAGPGRLAKRAGRACLRPGLRPRFQHDRGHGRPPAPQARPRRASSPSAASATVWVTSRVIALGLAAAAPASGGAQSSSSWPWLQPGSPCRRCSAPTSMPSTIRNLVLQLDGLTAALHAGRRRQAGAARSTEPTPASPPPMAGATGRSKCRRCRRCARARSGTERCRCPTTGSLQACWTGTSSMPRASAGLRVVERHGPIRTGAGPTDPGRRRDAGGRDRGGCRPVRPAAADDTCAARGRPGRGLRPPDHGRAGPAGASRPGARRRAHRCGAAAGWGVPSGGDVRWSTSSTGSWPSRSGRWSVPAGRQPIWPMP